MEIQAIIEKVREAGVVGAGGAGFPTWRKLDCRGRVDTLILNGAECEPLLYADYYCLLHEGEKILEAAAALRDALGLRSVILGVKRKRQALVSHLEKLLAGHPGITLLGLADVYPSGDEHLLVYAATGRVVPQGGIPLDVGVLVQNVQTLAHIGDALEGRPVTRRFVTLAGAVARPFTAEAAVGTPLARLLEAAGGPTCPDPRYLAGGVMMGALAGEDFAVQKTTSGILVLPPDNPAVRERNSSLTREARVSKSVCDQCFTCTELCPRYLLGHDIQPHLLMRRAETVLERPGEADHIAWYCCECGVCSLIACPVRITPRRLIAGMKRRMPPPHKKPKPECTPHPDYDRKGLPMAYVLKRLALEAYNVKNCFLGPLPEPERVWVCRDEFGGGQAAPLVQTGQRVIPGEPVAEGKHTRHHAPIGGRVTAVDAAIEITAE